MSRDDALAIANLKAGYCRAADLAASDPAAARAALIALFTDDAAADYGMGTLAGPVAIADFLRTAIAGDSVWMLHLIGSPAIVVSGDEAQGDWAVIVRARRRDGGETTVAGRYADAFRRTGGDGFGGWRIAWIGFARLG